MNDIHNKSNNPTQPRILRHADGGLYQHIGTANPAGKAKEGGSSIEVYRAIKDGRLWYRAPDDFADRFEAAATPEPAAPVQTLPENVQKHIEWLHQTLRENGLCIDGGKCHHGCKKHIDWPCFRAESCVPLSGSKLSNYWRLDSSAPEVAAPNAETAPRMPNLICDHGAFMHESCKPCDEANRELADAAAARPELYNESLLLQAACTAREALEFYANNSEVSITFEKGKRDQELQHYGDSLYWEKVGEDRRGHEIFRVTTHRAAEALQALDELEEKVAAHAAPTLPFLAAVRSWLNTLAADAYDAMSDEAKGRTKPINVSDVLHALMVVAMAPTPGEEQDDGAMQKTATT